MSGKHKGWQHKFREQGLRVTGPRLLVLDILAAARRYLSAKEIHTRIVTRDPSVGSATVYRTLDILVSMGLVTRNDFGEGFYRYELLRPGTNDTHVHLICESCGRTLDVEIKAGISESINRLSEILYGDYQFEMNQNRINFFGNCSYCNSNDGL